MSHTGVGHPDPDDVYFTRKSAAQRAYQILKVWPDDECRQFISDPAYLLEPDLHTWRRHAVMPLISAARSHGMHGCDGCCSG